MMDASVLPIAWAMQWALVLGWVVMTVWLLVGGVRVCSKPATPQRTAMLMAVFAVLTVVMFALPGHWSPRYYLGLAFQAPSVMSLALCSMALWRWQGATTPWAALPMATTQHSVQTYAPGQAASRVAALCAALAAVALGWWLLLDTLGLMPGAVYAWGYGRHALWSALAALLLWASALHFFIGASVQQYALPALAVLAIFAATRLTTGNMWDALIDPWLWIASHLLLGREILHRMRAPVTAVIWLK
jgi:hypothetical protein